MAQTPFSSQRIFLAIVVGPRTPHLCPQHTAHAGLLSACESKTQLEDKPEGQKRHLSLSPESLRRAQGDPGGWTHTRVSKQVLDVCTRWTCLLRNEPSISCQNSGDRE